MVLAKINAIPLPKEEVENLVARLLAEILRRLEPLEIILFGSAARGQMTAYSDLDVVIVIDEAHDIKPTIRKLGGVSAVLHWPVDLLVVDKRQYDVKKDLGGVFWDAHAFGTMIFKRGPI